MTKYRMITKSLTEVSVEIDDTLVKTFKGVYAAEDARWFIRKHHAANAIVVTIPSAFDKEKCDADKPNIIESTAGQTSGYFSSDFPLRDGIAGLSTGGIFQGATMPCTAKCSEENET